MIYSKSMRDASRVADYPKQEQLDESLLGLLRTAAIALMFVIPSVLEKRFNLLRQNCDNRGKTKKG